MRSPLNQSLTHGWGETHTIPRPSTRVTSPLQILHLGSQVPLARTLGLC